MLEHFKTNSIKEKKYENIKPNLYFFQNILKKKPYNN